MTWTSHPKARAYEVRHKPDHHGWGFSWRLYITGPGHWCEGSNGTGGLGFGGAYPSEHAAHEAGRQWIETGRLRNDPDKVIGDGVEHETKGIAA